MTTTRRATDGAIARDVKRRLARAAVAGDAHEELRERHGAHEELVTAAFVDGRTRLQPLFYELFPPPEDLADLRNTPLDPRGPFKALASRNVAARRRAAEFFEKRGRDELGMGHWFLLRDPRTVARLLRSAADADAAVQADAIRALGHVVGRFKYRSPEVLETLLALHPRARNGEIRRELAIALITFDDPRKWPLLVEALSEPRLNELARRRLIWTAGVPASMPRDVTRQVAERLLALLRAEKKLDLRLYLLGRLGDVGDLEAAAELRTLALRGVRPEKRDEAIAAIEKRHGARKK